MRVAPAELLARKTSHTDSGNEDDSRRHKAQFDLALSGLREERQAADGSGHGDDNLRSGHGERDRRRGGDHSLDADGLSEDQVLSATDNNPVLAALAAAHGPWQTAYGSGGGSPVRAIHESPLPHAIHESLLRQGPSDNGASSNRRVDVPLTVMATDSRIISHTLPATRRVESAYATRVFEGLPTDARPLGSEAEQALIAAQNASSTTTVATGNGPLAEAPNGANPPSLPMPTAQRLVDGTVAALRIDRDTANPQHSASIIEVRHPELGVVKVEVQLRGNAMELRFEAAGHVVAMLRASESVLRKAVSQHGLRLRNLQVMDRSTLMQERSRRTRRHLLDLEA